MSNPEKKSYGYYKVGYSGGGDRDTDGLCDSMSFTTAEAYKMLRTKINLLIPKTLNEATGEEEQSGKAIGITSALRGEGKSTTAINLAYTIAEAGHKVCLVEADMRLPNLAKRLSLKQTPGLSNLLTGQATGADTMQKYVSKSGSTIYAIVAGDIPPRPSELLESSSMNLFIKSLRKSFDYVIVDLPPVTVVTDAIAVSQYLSGMLLVVRENYCDKGSLRDALYQFGLTNTNILGVVFNSSDGPSGKSGYYRKAKKYYKKDYYEKGYRA